MAITAAGMEAETVIPTRSPKYAFAAPKITARSIPITIEVTVSSGVIFSAGIYGLNSLFSIFLCFLSVLFYNWKNNSVLNYRLSATLEYGAKQLKNFSR